MLDSDFAKKTTLWKQNASYEMAGCIAIDKLIQWNIFEKTAPDRAGFTDDILLKIFDHCLEPHDARPDLTVKEMLDLEYANLLTTGIPMKLSFDEHARFVNVLDVAMPDKFKELSWLNLRLASRILKAKP